MKVYAPTEGTQTEGVIEHGGERWAEVFAPAGLDIPLAVLTANPDVLIVDDNGPKWRIELHEAGAITLRWARVGRTRPA
jgi:hypothetical protein